MMLQSQITWDFQANALTLPVDDITWIGHFNDRTTMGFGTVVGLSLRGRVSLAPTDISYSLSLYILTPRGEVFWHEYDSSTPLRKVSSSRRALTPLLMSDAITRRPDSSSRDTREDLLVESLDKLSTALDEASPGMVKCIIEEIQNQLPQVLDHLKLQAISTYLENVFEPTFSYLRQDLTRYSQALQESVAQFVQAYAPFRDIDVKSVDVIDPKTNPNATKEQLMDLKSSLEAAYQAVCGVADFENGIQSVQDTWARVQSLKSGSLLVFEQVNLVHIHQAFWNQYEHQCVNVLSNLDYAKHEYRPRLLDKLADLLIAIPQRIEWERENNTVGELHSVSSEIVSTLKDGARKIGAAAFRSRLVAQAREIESSLQRTSAAIQFCATQTLVSKIESSVLPELKSRATNSDLLTAEEKVELSA